MPKRTLKRTKTPIRIGFDLDGVLLYNPARIIRRPVKSFKRRFIPKRENTFFVPHSPLMKFIWHLFHKSSVWVADGYDMIVELSKDPDIEIYLVTARFGYLRPDVEKWLRKINAKAVFVKCIINEKDEQPHQYKLKQVKKLKLNYFVEDNWDIVSHLAEKTDIKAYWIYNIFDRQVHYPLKFPTLKKAVTHIYEDLRKSA